MCISDQWVSSIRETVILSLQTLADLKESNPEGDHPLHDSFLPRLDSK